MGILGSASSGGDFGAAARATGIALGTGSDDLVTSRLIRTHATAATRSDVSSYAFAGVAGGNSALATEAIAAGATGLALGGERARVELLGPAPAGSMCVATPSPPAGPRRPPARSSPTAAPGRRRGWTRRRPRSRCRAAS